MDQSHSMESAKNRLLQAALPHVPFDGWSEVTLDAAMRDSDIAPGLAHALFPRGGVDLALAYHALGDVQMLDALGQTDLTTLRFRERITTAVRLRLQQADRELVRRASALFTLPQNAPDGSRAIWGTADAIWTALGDTSTDFNWYTKRATLSAVYGTTVLFWLGDDTPDHQPTWDFLDRRIENVMSLEATKTAFRQNALGKALLAGPLKILERVRAPQGRGDMPGKL